MEDITPTPTPQQDELFYLTVRNFVNTAPSHRQVLMDSRFSIAPAEVDKWLEKKDLPSLSTRSRIMDFVWTHYCNCKCN